MSLKRVRLNNLSTQKVSGRSLRLSRLSRKRFPFPSAASIIANYIEDVFSTYLYTGNGSTQTITNGIDLSGKGGILWTKNRQSGYEAQIYSSAVGVDKYLVPSTTASTASSLSGLAFNTNGFTLNSNDNSNASGQTGVSWTFRKQAKFFDVVTYTGNGANRTIAHNLGSVPGTIIIKRTDTSSPWSVYHRSLTNAEYLLLNTPNSKASGTSYWNSTTPTSTVFSLGTWADVNADTGTYVAYLFAHNAGGFGASGTDNVISCGSYTGNGGTLEVNLGYEAQWVFVKRTNDEGAWWCADIMRGMPVGGIDPALALNSINQENNSYEWIEPRANGFALTSASVVTTNSVNGLGSDYIYIAIRRGPMKTPTSGTSVFDVQTTSSVSSIATTSFSVVIDAYLQANRNATAPKALFPRLTKLGLLTYSTSNESDAGTLTANFGISPQTSVERPVVGGTSSIGVLYGFVRAPGFFDVVCYTGTGANSTVSHNLGVAPELMIVKSRNNATNWNTYLANVATNKRLFIDQNWGYDNVNTTDASIWNNTAPTASVFSIGGSANINTWTYVSYLFATCPGVSKVGSYTGTGTTLSIDCGFTSGARFVMIKRTDSTGDWYVWDTARGIIAGNDPYLLLNSTAGEVTNTDYIDPYNPGFELSSTAPVAINASGGTYIFLAIA